MTPKFANSAWVRTRERLVLRGGAWRPIDLPVRYGIFEHPRIGLCLIDTGYTAAALEGADRSLAMKVYGWALKPRLIPEGQAKAVLSGFGASCEDVKAVIVTHFHVDHISGLGLFPNAKVYMRKDIHDRASNRGTLANLRHGVLPELLMANDAGHSVDIAECAQVSTLTPFAQGHDLFGDGTVIAIDLPGHAEGHFGVLFPKLERPLMYAVDAQWMRAAYQQDRVPGFPAAIVADDPRGQLRTIAALKTFEAAGGDIVLCHDPAVTQYDLASGPAS
ncbi:MBL fold metallo-hydrolase [Nereida sp. MMG025]|uniref:MBL fold metallo-hydrolase n=1 Tax=Nereida sp. MMG025 TaxID=2909981 RepID=UPI001F34AB22|nr:MBL fold metallo-hydrolase [Nereida sp. MMG025]MCF6443738.1 MBL fold metallo-hydrolase [Nereida sp. MMG025]